jgi:hypothetical protein
MNPELISQYDVAEEALDGFTMPAAEESATLEAWLADDVAASRREGVRDWFPRWVLAPLGALRVFAALHDAMLTALAETRLELSWLDQQLARLPCERRAAEAESFARRRNELLAHQAALAERLEGERERRALAARGRIAHRLEVALRFTAADAAGGARDVLCVTAATLTRVLGSIEGYERVAREARSLASGLRLPSFLPEEVARLRAAASLGTLTLAAAPGDVPVEAPPVPAASEPDTRVFRAASTSRAFRTA